jgi:hypothetical protein
LATNDSKPHKPYEFGVEVSVATTLKRCKGGQFVTHVQALPGNPYDGHTLVSVIPRSTRSSALRSSGSIPTPPRHRRNPLRAEVSIG